MLEAIQYWQEFWQYGKIFVSLYYLLLSRHSLPTLGCRTLNRIIFSSIRALTEKFSVIWFSARKKFVAVCKWVGYKHLY
jgi:hypothetical protein